MFVNCFAKKPLYYHNYGRTLVLKPGVNCVDESLFPIEELLKTYGYALINIIGREMPEIEKAPKLEKVLEENKEIKDFLEGETDKLPEGTEVIDIPAIVDEPKEDAPAVVEEPKEVKVEVPKKPARKPAKKTK